MKLTNRQWYLLRWLGENGGRAKLHGGAVVIGEKKTNASASQPFLHLVQKGAVEGKDGFLQITEYGKRLLAV